DFLEEVKRGEPEVRAPVYSHVVYDIVEGEEQVLRHPDIVILEGLNVLQTGTHAGNGSRFVSDFFDLSIYVDAEEADIERWYVERCFARRRTAFADSTSFFRHFADLGDADLEAAAHDIWARINRPNLRENILPSRPRADLVLQKGPDHEVRQVRMRMRGGGPAALAPGRAIMVACVTGSSAARS